MFTFLVAARFADPIVSLSPYQFARDTFAHDLMGDWARFHILSYAPNDAVRTIKEVAPIPRWGHAIRLYAQSLVEQGEGLTNWKTVTAQLAGEDAESRLASDLFLDGLLFAANAEALLEQVWPDLIANEGVMLRRLIKRLELVASIPDIRLRGLVEPEGGGASRDLVPDSSPTLLVSGALCF